MEIILQRGYTNTEVKVNHLDEMPNPGIVCADYRRRSTRIGEGCEGTPQTNKSGSPHIHCEYQNSKLDAAKISLKQSRI
jgi:hypothetical protein